MSETSASWVIHIPPPLLYVLAFLAGIASDRAVPLHQAWIHSFGWVGWLLLVLGIALGPANAMAFLLQRTTLNPAARPTKLVTGGAYRISRNPMYLGLAAIYVGLAMLLGHAWPLILLPVPLYLINKFVVPHEEAQSRAAFGQDYLSYCKQVRRWL